MWFRRKPDPDAGRIAIGNFSLNATLAGSSGRSVQMAGYIYSDDDIDTLNARLDLYEAVVERQRIKAEIPELEAKREQMLKGLDQAREVLADMHEKQKNGGQLSSQERMNMKNLGVNIDKMADEIDRGTAAIEEAKRKAA
jgi:hypothetical protein